VLGGTSVVGDVLVGRRKWTDAKVLRGRDELLRPTSAAAIEYVRGFAVWCRNIRRHSRRWLGRRLQSYFAAGEQREFSDGSDNDSRVSSLDAPSSQESGGEHEGRGGGVR
jgi:hypothetical protein